MEAVRYQVDRGLSTLGPEALEILDLLDRRFLDWADERGAERMRFPPLLPVEDLEQLDFFRNFPHLAAPVSRLREDCMDGCCTAGLGAAAVPPEKLRESRWVLPTAACYPAYLHLRGQRLRLPRTLTTVATCHRNEETYDGLRRLRAFTMREVICVGPKEAVETHLASFRRSTLELAAELELPVTTAAATDRFFQTDGPRARMQRLFPVKEEVLFGDLALASLNFHRNFFGERCEITTDDGETAFSGCVGWGLERWLAALLERHGSDRILQDLLRPGVLV